MTILIFILIIALLIIIHELGHFIAAKKSGVLVEEFGFGFPPRIFSIKRGETVYSLNLLPFGGFVKVYGEEYHEESKISDKLKDRGFIYKKPWQKSLIIIAGIAGNFILAWVLISYIFTQGVPIPTNKVIVENAQINSPAQKAGIKKNDVISKIVVRNTAYNLTSTSELIDLTSKFAGEPMILEIKRGSEKVQVSLTPRKNPPKNQGPLGIVITSTTFRTYAWYEAPFYAFGETLNRTKQITIGLFQVLGQVFTFQKPSVEVAGPIGIAQLTGQVVKHGGSIIPEFIAMLSLNLAVINILPFPALDGGRLTFVLYEWVTRKRVNRNFERYVNTFGIIILLSLAVIISINDIVKLVR